jgi:hypothetical protein
MTDQNSSSQAVVPGLEIAVEETSVVLRLAGGPEFRLTPEAAKGMAERLWEAAGQARGADSPRKGPPFPPHQLVSPHAAG